LEKPIADGGDGLLEIIREVMGGEERSLEVTGPNFSPVTCSYLYLPEKATAVVEMARASGLALLPPEERNPTLTTSRGTGEVARQAIAAGARHLVIGLGGSATTDAGCGFAAAFGVRFLDRQGVELSPIGGNLGKIARIELGELRQLCQDITFEAICDVDNPLLGERGAAAVFGPQKGATPLQVDELEKGLAHWAGLVVEELGVSVASLPGAGAAGGLGAGLAAFFSARLRPGVEVVLDLVGLDAALRGADLVFTGEGRLDGQTAGGKGPAGVVKRAALAGVPCIAIAGEVTGDLAELRRLGLSAAFSLCSGPISLQVAKEQAENLLARATREAFLAFLAGRGVKPFREPGRQ
jgi:glycerate kinase